MLPKGSFQFQKMATRVINGVDSVSVVGQELKKLNGSKTLVVTDAGLVAAGVVEKVTEVLKADGLECSIYDKVEPNPRAETVEEGYRVYASESCDSLVAVGGGSPMDTAKGIGVLAAHGGGPILEYQRGGGRSIANPLPPFICIPTTYGTGSEVTQFSVITDTKTGWKGTLVSLLLLPEIAILDPTLCVALPMKVGGPCGMDALTHAVESYTCINAHPLTDAYNIYAIYLIAENLRKACTSNDNLEAANNMLLASCITGMVFWRTLLGNVHAMSHPLGGHLDIPHGIANALLLPHVMEYNLVAAPERFINIAHSMGEITEGLPEMEAAAKAVEAVRELSADVGIPQRMSDVGVKKDQIPTLAKDAMRSPNVNINPRKTTYEDVVSIYEAAL